MNQIIESNLKIKLIALGLLFILPITINLGIDFIYPKIRWETFQKTEEQFIERNMPNYDTFKKIKGTTNNKRQASIFKEYNKYKNQWYKSEEYKELKNKNNHQKYLKHIILLFIIMILMIILNFINIPVITSSLIGSILYLFIFELNNWNPHFNAFAEETLFHIPVPILGMLLSLFCTILILYYAHKDQNL